MSQTKIQTIDCTSAEGLLAELERLAVPYVTSPRPQLPMWFYRGHMQSDWLLHGSATRDLLLPVKSHLDFIWQCIHMNEKNVEQAIPENPMESTKEHRENLVGSAHIRLTELVTAFAELAGELGLLHGAAASEATQLINRQQFCLGAPLLPRVAALMGLAQHHGIRTPLLDWTRDPLVAMWFACREIVTRDDILEDKWACVWGIPRSVLQSIDRVSVYVVIDQVFARSQGGLFTYDSQAARDFIETGHVPAMDQIIAESINLEARSKIPAEIQMPSPFTIRFPHKIAPRLLAMLRYKRISSAHLMPTLENVSRVVRDIRNP